MKNNARDILQELIGENNTSGDMIRAARKTLECSQEELSKLTGIGVTTISKYENNQINIGPIPAAKFAAALGISPISILYPMGIDHDKTIKSIRKKSEKFFKNHFNEVG